MIIRLEDLTNEAVNIGMWDALLTLAGYEKKEHGNSTDTEIEITSAKIFKY